MRRLAAAVAALCSVASPAPGRLLQSDFAALAGTPPLDARIPADLVFEDEQGREVKLGGLLAEGPVLLALGYYRCRTICSIGFRELAARRAEASLGTPVLLVSIDSREGPPEARAAHAATAQGDASWHFLTDRTGSAAAALARTAGLPFRYDPDEDVYAHAAEILVVDREGRIAAALPELGYDAETLRRAVAATERPSSALGQAAVLLCYAFDPATGRYSLAVARLLQLGAAATVLGLGGAILLLRRRGS